MEHLSNLTDPLTRFSAAVPVVSHNASAGDSAVAAAGGGAGSDYEHAASSAGYNAVHNMQTVLLPFIFVLGFVGNSLAIGCFLSPSLRSASCCLYMAAKCVSDTAFLATMLLMWLDRVNVAAVNVQGVCQLTVFLSYVSGFVSVWLVLAITYENYIRICCPHLTKIRCTWKVALSVTTAIVVFAVVFYSFALWTTNVLGGGAESPLCMSLLKFKDVLMVMTFIDTLITLVLPCLIIVPLVIASLMAILKAYDRKNRLHDSLLSKAHATHAGFQNSMEAKVAQFLLFVSLTFLLLHTPGHLIRLKLLISRYILNSPLTDTDAMLQRLFETLYYFNFCCSVVIFLASGANFRAIFVSMYFRKLRHHRDTCADSYQVKMEQRMEPTSCENRAFDEESLGSTDHLDDVN